ncbi:MAG: acyl dehydratase, partial [Sphingomonadaceae bacterium]|nr:acyl dehydratase [Sphingomonadaceae bacterium]
NQRDEETVRGTARIVLPSKDKPLPMYPPVPDDLAETAARMMARHWELGGT